MDIAILHYSLAPVIGGVERLIEDQAAALRQLGHRVGCMSSPTAFRAWLKALRPLQVGQPRPAVLVHNVFTMPFDLPWTRELTALCTSRPDLQWVNWVHDVCACNPQYRRLRWLEPTPQALHVAVSRVRQAEWAAVSGLRPSLVKVIANGVDCARLLGLAPRVAAMDLPSHEVVLLQPARLVPRKNIELGIEIIACWQRQGIDAQLVVTGAPDPHQATGVVYLRRLKALARRLGVAQRVRFAGEQQPLDEAEVRSLYRVADALFFPSFSEGFGLPLLEALAHRLPIFCSDLDVHREVLGNLACRWPQGLDVEEISARILRRLQSPACRRRRRLLFHRHSMLRLCREQLLPLLGADSSPEPKSKSKSKSKSKP